MTTQKTKAIICDLDGTLAIMGEREPFDWYNVHLDTPNAPVIEVVRRFASDHNILIVTGRSDICRVATQGWLASHVGHWDRLYMRTDGDYRKDAIVKRELWEEKIIPCGYEITFALDDRNQSVEFWRSLGIPCFQVAPGNF